jgi:hypothetical protein
MRLPSLAVIACCISAGVVTTVLSLPVHAYAAQEAAPAAAPKKVLSPPEKANVTLPNATITIDYGAPSMRGREIFGALVPYGKVWRTGANPATTFKTTGDLQIGDLKVPAGNYTLYTLPAADGWKLIINKQTGQWGTVYNEPQDLGRTPMTVGSNASPVETMVIDFEKTAGNSTELHVKWANVDASVKVSSAK